jgi:SHS2 domain-containing protein
VRSFEILEHTADVGIRARAESLPELFLCSAEAVLEIMGGRRPNARARSEDAENIEITAPDLGALMVDWLGEVLYVVDARDAVVTQLMVEAVGIKQEEWALAASLATAPRAEGEPEGTAVKAITYHRLKIEETSAGWVAEAYVDV